MLAASALSGCQSPPPSASLHAGNVGVRVQATRWCPEGKKCVSYHPGVPLLKVHAPADVLVEVDDAVAKRPWIVLVEGGTASSLQEHSHSYRLKALRAPVTVEVVTVDTDGTRVLQRDHWIFRVTKK